MKETAQYKQLQEALNALKELQIPENLQETAFKHLLGVSAGSLASVPTSLPASNSGSQIVSVSQTSSLREFMADLKPKGAVAEIPCLVYWAKTYENAEALDENGIVELYRRAGLRPPKNVMQSLRDLCSKKYDRLNSAGNGEFKLSRVGEDFVLHDVKTAA